jgi:dihydrofolate reductase
VISKSLDKAEWNNTTLITDNIADEISKLKQQPGKDMMIFGSPRLSHNLMQLGLIDEFQLTLNPIILGSGIPLFKDIKEKFKCNVTIFVIRNPTYKWTLRHNILIGGRDWFRCKSN